MADRVDLIGDDDSKMLEDSFAGGKTSLDMLEPPPRRAPMVQGISRPSESDSPFGGLPSTIPLSMSTPIPSRRVAPSSPKTRTTVKYRTLEELYAHHADELGQDGVQLRVQRISPQIEYDEFGNKHHTSGILGRELPNITTEEFQAKYGGYKYAVYLEVPSGSEDLFGAPKRFDRAVCEFELTGRPNLNSLPSMEEDNMMMNPIGRKYPVVGYRTPQQTPDNGSDSSTIKTVLDYVRSSNQQVPAVAPSDTVFQAFQNQGNNALHVTKEMAQLQVDTLRAQLEKEQLEKAEMRRALLEREEKDRNKPTDVEKIFQSVALLNSSQQRTATEESLEALRRQHSSELEHMRASNRDQLESIMRQNEMAMASARQTFEVQLKTLESRNQDLMMAFDRERAQLKDEAERREREAKRDGERQIEMARRDSDRQIELIKAQYESRLHMLEQNSKSEKHMMQESYKLVSKSDENTAAMQIAIIKQENERLKSEIASMQEELEGARAERNKPLVEQVQEIKQTAELLGLNSSEGKEEESKFDIKQLLATSAPALIQAFMSKQQPADPAAAAQQHRALPPGPSAQQQAQAQQQQAQMQQNRRRRPLPANRIVFQEDDAPPIVTSTDRRPNIYVEPVPVPSYAPPAPTVSTPPPAPQPATSMNPPAQTTAPSIPPPPPTMPPTHPDEHFAEFSWLMAPIENLRGLLGLIEQACSNEEPPENVALFLEQQAGKDNLKVMMAAFDIDRFVESINEAKATRDGVLATRRGNKYVKSLFSELKRIAES